MSFLLRRLYFWGSGVIEGMGYAVSQYVIGNKEGKAAGTLEHRAKMEGNKETRN